MINPKSFVRANSLVALSSVAFSTLLMACNHAGGQAGGSAGAPANCTPLETREANAVNQRPAFTGQTRTCGITSSAPYDVVVVTKSLEKPWSVEPLPNGDLLVTEKAGKLRIVSATGQVGEPITGVPAVDSRGQGGLLDVALSPTFANDRTIFWTFTEARDGGNGTSIARGVLSSDRRSLSDVRVIFRVLPAYEGRQHYGSRIAFGPDGKLYASFGERSVTAMRPNAQKLDSHLGKTIRINLDGSVPTDNPFVGRPDARPEIWALGHRNPEALAFDGKGGLWDIEHGTRGGDELNHIEKGKNYGWPLQAYGEEYSGVEPVSSPIGSASTTLAGMEQPTYYWDPVIAPSGAQFYSGNAFPAWRGNLFVGALKEMRLVRLVINNENRVVGEEHLLVGRNQRVRDVRQGPDGMLYVVTDQDAGELWKIVPRK
jgi:glucose/arabinose dehydrogenase